MGFGYIEHIDSTLNSQFEYSFGLLFGYARRENWPRAQTDIRYTQSTFAQIFVAQTRRRCGTMSYWQRWIRSQAYWTSFTVLVCQKHNWYTAIYRVKDMRNLCASNAAKANNEITFLQPHTGRHPHVHRRHTKDERKQEKESNRNTRINDTEDLYLSSVVDKIQLLRKKSYKTSKENIVILSVCHCAGLSAHLKSITKSVTWTNTSDCIEKRWKSYCQEFCKFILSTWSIVEVGRFSPPE